LVIFDCNGVLVDSEPIAAAVLADAFKRIGIVLPADTVVRRFQGRRPSDILAAVEAATNQELPPQFPGEVATETLRRLRTELRAVAHAAHALTWIRGPKAVASSSSPPADAATGTAPGNYALSVSSMTGSGTQATTVMITIVKE